MLFNIVLSLVILVCILLVLIILAQNSKGGGLSSQFGGAGASNMIGVKKTGDLLENLTWGLVIGMFVLVISSAFLLGTGGETRDIVRERAGESQMTAPSLDLEGVEGAGENSDALDLSEELTGDSVN